MLMQKADTRGIERMSSFYQSFYSFVIFVVFLCIFFGADKASSFISILPEWSIHGLSVAVV